MSRPGRTITRLAVVGVLCASVVALAAASPLLISVWLTGGTLSLTTNSMPKGWFDGNTFDRTKTSLVTQYGAGATSCSAAVSGVPINSVTAGTFTPVLNPAGKVNAWTWATTMDVSGYQNRWHNYLRCDGSVTLSGCNLATPINVTTTAYDRNGACHQYINDAGLTVCASDTKTVYYAAVQEADEYETCAPAADDCGIGECQSACQHQCSGEYAGTVAAQNDQRRECRRACECQCKIEIRTGTSCNIEPKCE